MLVGDYEFGRSAEDISLLKMISERRRRRSRPVRRRRQPQAVQLRQLHRAGQPARPGQDLRERRVRGLEVVPRIGGFALRRPDHAARPGPAALRRELQAGRRVQLRGVRGRQGPQQVPVDERGLGLRGAHHRRLRQVRLDGPHPRRRGRRQGRRACRSTPSRPTTATWP